MVSDPAFYALSSLLTLLVTSEISVEDGSMEVGKSVVIICQILFLV